MVMHRVRRLWTGLTDGLRYWWLVRRRAREKRRLVRLLPTVRRGWAFVALQDGGGMALVRDRVEARTGIHVEAGAIGSGLTNSLLQRLHLPRRLTPDDLGYDHLVVCRDGQRLLFRKDDDLMPLLIFGRPVE